MKQFKIELFKGHPLLKSGSAIILIDTGAPATLHTSDTFTFCEETYDTKSDYLGMTVEILSEMLGTEITTLLGADILSKYQIMFDYKNESVTFSKTEISFEGTEIALSSFKGIPLIEFSIDDQPLKFFLDTGAKLSYVSNNVTKNHQSIGIEEDFYPGLGKFETDCYEITTRLGTNDFAVTFGKLHPILQMSAMLGDTNGIIGYDFFRAFQIVLDLKNNTLKYSSN